MDETCIIDGPDYHKYTRIEIQAYALSHNKEEIKELLLDIKKHDKKGYEEFIETEKESYRYHQENKNYRTLKDFKNLYDVVLNL